MIEANHFLAMCLETIPAILLRKTRFSDTSLIITWLTQEHGKLKTIAKGALRPKSRFGAALDLFYSCEIAITRSTRSDLHTLREVQLLDPRETIRAHFYNVALAAYFVELLDLATEIEHPVPELYDLLDRALRHLQDKQASKRALTHFEDEIAKNLGIQNPSIPSIAAIARSIQTVPSSRSSLLISLPEMWQTRT